MGGWRPIDWAVTPTAEADFSLPLEQTLDDRPSSVLTWTTAMPDWHRQASCRVVTDWDDVYFGAQPRLVSDDEAEEAEAPQQMLSSTRLRIAQATCAVCPVIAECATHALRTPEEFGIWAGTTPAMRQKALDLISSGIISFDEAVEVICEGAVQTFKELSDALTTALRDVS